MQSRGALTLDTLHARNVDLFYIVLSQVDPEGLAWLRQTCRTLRDLIDARNFWLSRLRPRPANYERLSLKRLKYLAVQREMRTKMAKLYFSVEEPNRFQISEIVVLLNRYREIGDLEYIGVPRLHALIENCNDECLRRYYRRVSIPYQQRHSEKLAEANTLPIDSMLSSAAERHNRALYESSFVHDDVQLYGRLADFETPERAFFRAISLYAVSIMDEILTGYERRHPGEPPSSQFFTDNFWTLISAARPAQKKGITKMLGKHGISRLREPRECALL